MPPMTNFAKFAIATNQMCTTHERNRQKAVKMKLKLLRSLWRKRTAVLFRMLLTLFNCLLSVPRPIRNCKRLPRGRDWFINMWNSNNDVRFEKNFRMTRGTFLFILNSIRSDLQREEITEFPIPPEVRLAACINRLARGDYLHTVSELFGLGRATVCQIVTDVSLVIVNRLWHQFISFPTSDSKAKTCMTDFEELWQFPCCIGAVDGCNLSIKCPAGGQESAKEYHNFKNFYSIVLMAVVDAKQRFTWAASDFPGNSHDSIIFQATKLYDKIVNGELIPKVGEIQSKASIYPMLIGESAFPFNTWLMKPHGNAILTPEQSYFNYHLSHARMVVESAFGQLKGRWRVLLQKCECDADTVKMMSLVCCVLHNICIDLSDKFCAEWDLCRNPGEKNRRPKEELHDLLHLTKCRGVANANKNASIVDLFGPT